MNISHMYPVHYILILLGKIQLVIFKEIISLTMLKLNTNILYITEQQNFLEYVPFYDYFNVLCLYKDDCIDLYSYKVSVSLNICNNRSYKPRWPCMTQVHAASFSKGDLSAGEAALLSY